MLELKIDHEFQQKIPPLTADEYQQLEENILKAGVIFNPIVTWHGFILDGHNRYKIWTEHQEIPEPKTVCVDETLEDRWAALEWICKNQLGRRNLNELQKAALVGLAYEARKHSNGGDRRSKTFSVRGNRELKKNGQTSIVIAEELGMTANQVDHAYRFVSGLRRLEEITPGITDKILAGETGVSKEAVSGIHRNSPDEQKQFADAIMAGEKPPVPKNMPSRLKLKNEKKSKPVPAPAPTSESSIVPGEDVPAEEVSGEQYLPDYTIEMLNEEILANFTSFLNSSSLLLEWHGNLLADKHSKNKIIDLINFEIHQLKKVRLEIDEKF